MHSKGEGKPPGARVAASSQPNGHHPACGCPPPNHRLRRNARPMPEGRAAGCCGGVAISKCYKDLYRRMRKTTLLGHLGCPNPSAAQLALSEQPMLLLGLIPQVSLEAISNDPDPAQEQGQRGFRAPRARRGGISPAGRPPWGKFPIWQHKWAKFPTCRSPPGALLLTFRALHSPRTPEFTIARAISPLRGELGTLRAGGRGQLGPSIPCPAGRYAV